MYKIVHQLNNLVYRRLFGRITFLWHLGNDIDSLSIRPS